MRLSLKLQSGLLIFLLGSSMVTGSVRPPSLDATRDAFKALKPALSAAAGIATLGELVEGVFRLPQRLSGLGLNDLFEEVMGPESPTSEVLPFEPVAEDSEEEDLAWDAFDDLAFD